MFDFFESILGTLVLILDIVAIFDIVTGPKETFKKVLWTLAIIILPVLGLILYYLFGKENLLSRIGHQ